METYKLSDFYVSRNAPPSGFTDATFGSADVTLGSADATLGSVDMTPHIGGSTEASCDICGGAEKKTYKLSDFYVTGGKSKNTGKSQKRNDDGEDRSKPLADMGDDYALSRVSTNTSECSESCKRGPGQPCSSQRVVSTIRSFVAASGVEVPPDDTLIIQRAAQVLGCGSESCVITHPRLREHARTQGSETLLSAELSRRFKPEGPRNSTQLLSNFNIDDVLQEWAAVFPKFYNYGFNMMDFESTGGSLARIDVADILKGAAPQDLGRMGGIVRRPCDTFACVLNTDVSSGRGKHWVAVFGDCRTRGEWTIEYFNSAGNPPPPPVTRWLEDSAARLIELRAKNPQQFGAAGVIPIPLTDIRHQDSQTECGLYALFFIRRRLEGAPPSEFQNTRISDDAMIEFRKHIFREN